MEALNIVIRRLSMWREYAMKGRRDLYLIQKLVGCLIVMNLIAQWKVRLMIKLFRMVRI